MNSAHSSRRMMDCFNDNDPRVPSEDVEEKKKPSGKKGKSIGFPKMSIFSGKRSVSEEKKGLSELLQVMDRDPLSERPQRQEEAISEQLQRLTEEEISERLQAIKRYFEEKDSLLEILQGMISDSLSELLQRIKRDSEEKKELSEQLQEIKRDSEEKEALSKLQGMGIHRYDYRVLHGATDGFSERYLIGRRHFGNVYKGMLEGQQEVAIEVPTVQNLTLEMVTKMKVWSEMRHPNVVQLLGWSFKAGHLALVFEFVPNGSLEAHLHGEKDLPTLPWKVRYWRIAVGLASALQYLHEGLKECAVLGDIYADNVLLDSDFNPKLAHFLSAEVVSRGIGGIYDYTNLENSCRKEFDIYTFGQVALAIATGRIPSRYVDKEWRHLTRWVKELHEKGSLLKAADPNLGDAFEDREMERLLLVGLKCTQSQSRPLIKLILRLLNFEVPMLPKCTRIVVEPEDLLAFDVDRYMLENTEVENTEFDDQSLEPDGDSYQDDEDTPASSPEHTLFDIGLPPGLGSAAWIESNRTDHHLNVLKAFVHGLHEMIMRSGENLPRFDDALKKISSCTTALVVMVSPPLDDWNTLTQLVLRYLKEREDFLKLYTDGTPRPGDDDMRHVLSIREDESELEDCKERLACAQERCASLEVELATARGISSAIEEEMKDLERRITPERRRRYGIFMQYQHLLSQLSSFGC